MKKANAFLSVMVLSAAVLCEEIHARKNDLGYGGPGFGFGIPGWGETEYQCLFKPGTGPGHIGGRFGLGFRHGHGCDRGGYGCSHGCNHGGYGRNRGCNHGGRGRGYGAGHGGHGRGGRGW